MDDQPHVFSPADVVTEWKAAVFHSSLTSPDRTPWQGPPTDEVDAKWAELWDGTERIHSRSFGSKANSDVGKGVIKVSGVDAERLPNATLRIPGEEDGYIVGIEVFHQLHCLVRESLRSL